jgi:hypothetical protein
MGGKNLKGKLGGSGILSPNGQRVDTSCANTDGFAAQAEKRCEIGF